MAYKDIISGVYQILHKKSGKVYIGSSANIYSRWTDHRAKLNHGKHENQYLQRAYTKYGANAFEWSILQVASVEAMRDVEQFWFEITRCTEREHGYNIAPNAEHAGTGRKWTEEQRQAASKQRKGRPVSPEHRANLSKALKGIKRTPEQCENIRQAQLNRKRRTSPKVVETMRKRSTGAGNPKAKLTDDIVIAIREDYKAGAKYRQLSDKYSTPYSTIYNICCGHTWRHLLS